MTLLRNGISLALSALATTALLACGASSSSPFEESSTGSHEATTSSALRNTPPGEPPVIEPPDTDPPDTDPPATEPPVGRPPIEAPPTWPRPRRPIPRTCDEVNPACFYEGSHFNPVLAIEKALEAAGCTNPAIYRTNDPSDTPFSKAALCPDNDVVARIVGKYSKADFYAVKNANACDRCLARAPRGKTYVFWIGLFGPLCPSNCIDTPWGDETQSEY